MIIVVFIRDGNCFIRGVLVSKFCALVLPPVMKHNGGVLRVHVLRVVKCEVQDDLGLWSIGLHDLLTL